MSISIYSHIVWNIIYVFLLTNLNKNFTDNQKCNYWYKTSKHTTFEKEINSDNVETIYLLFTYLSMI